MYKEKEKVVIRSQCKGWYNKLEGNVSVYKEIQGKKSYILLSNMYVCYI